MTIQTQSPIIGPHPIRLVPFGCMACFLTVCLAVVSGCSTPQNCPPTQTFPMFPTQPGMQQGMMLPSGTTVPTVGAPQFAAQPFPGQPMPGQPMVGQPMPGQPMPGQPMYSQPPVYGQPMAGGIPTYPGAVPGQTLPPGFVPGTQPR